MELALQAEIAFVIGHWVVGQGNQTLAERLAP
jgi:hypothetical protein